MRDPSLTTEIIEDTVCSGFHAPPLTHLVTHLNDPSLVTDIIGDKIIYLENDP